MKHSQPISCDSIERVFSQACISFRCVLIGWLTDSVSCNGPKGFASGVLGILGAQASFPGKSTFLVKQTFLCL